MNRAKVGEILGRTEGTIIVSEKRFATVPLLVQIKPGTVPLMVLVKKERNKAKAPLDAGFFMCYSHDGGDSSTAVGWYD